MEIHVNELQRWTFKKEKGFVIFGSCRIQSAKVEQIIFWNLQMHFFEPYFFFYMWQADKKNFPENCHTNDND